MDKTTLIVGGYGHVGSLVARSLCRRGHAVILGGRDGRRAQRAGESFGARGVTVDVRAPATWEAALQNAARVLVCVDQEDAAFARYALERGRDYVDITASDAFFQRVEGLGDAAKVAGATAVLSVGLAPGLTNLLVRDAMARVEEPHRGRIGVRLGLGDAHGDAAISWLLQALSLVTAAPSFERISFDSDSMRTPVYAGALEFADQHVVRRTLGLSACETFLALEPAFATRPLFWARRFIALPAVRRFLRRALPHLRFGSNACSLAVEVHGRSVEGVPRVVRNFFRGPEEATITAAVTVGVLCLLEGARRPGVHHVEQLFAVEDIAPFVEEAGGELSLGWCEGERAPRRRALPHNPVSMAR